MNNEQLVELIRYRLIQADETLREAELLVNEGLYRGSINRSYYAMYYAIQTLAVLRQELFSKHSGIIAFFDREFIKTGLLPKELSRSLHMAFEQRQMSDYGEILVENQESAHQMLIYAREFILAIKTYLSGQPIIRIL